MVSVPYNSTGRGQPAVAWAVEGNKSDREDMPHLWSGKMVLGYIGS